MAGSKLDAASLRALGKKTVTREQFADIAGVVGMAELAEAVRPFVESAALVSFRNAGYAGPVNARVHNRYHVRLPEVAVDCDEQALRSLHPSLLANGWLARHPAAFVKHQRELEQLSAWLWHAAGSERLPTNERALTLSCDPVS